MLRSTHTYVELQLSQASYDEIRRKLEAADYKHCFMPDGTIDMHGIGVTRSAEPDMAFHVQKLENGATLDGKQTPLSAQKYERKNDTLAKTLNTVPTTPCAPNPFVKKSRFESK